MIFAKKKSTKYNRQLMIEPSLIAYYFPEFNEVLYLGRAALHLNPRSDLMTVL